LACAAVFFGGCGPVKITTTGSPLIDQYQVQTIAMIPFERLSTPQILDKPLTPEFSVPRGAERSQISVPVPPPSPEKLNVFTTVVPTDAAERVTVIFYERLRQREELRVLPPQEGFRAIRVLERGKTETLEQAAAEAASQLGADAALIGRVLVYKEREGNKIAANAAAVGFEVKLIGADGAILWTGNYYEKQRPLVEDLAGFIERGGIFVTADQLADYGAERLVRRFPYGRR
jgi:hypothetical protein